MAKRQIIFWLASGFLVLALLAGCGGAPTAPSGEASGPAEQGPAASSSAGTPAPTPTATAMPTDAPAASARPSPALKDLPAVFDPQFVALLGADNAAVAQRFSGQTYAAMTGSGAAALEYFEPYCRVLFEPQSTQAEVWCRELWGDAGSSPEDYDSMEEFWADKPKAGLYEGNPYAPGLPVCELLVQARLDPAKPEVLGQDSLKQLFLTEEEVTYELLCRELGQTPGLEHGPGDYCQRTPESVPPWQIHEPGWLDGLEEIGGGVYRTRFEVNGIMLDAAFVQQQGRYVCFEASICLARPE